MSAVQDYRAPADLDAAVRLLGEDPIRTRVLGGGTWLVPELSRADGPMGVRVIDLRRAGLGGVHAEGDVVHIGATCSYAALEQSPLIAQRLPLLHAMAGGVTGGRQIRNQGTIGGSVAAARPQSDAPAALAALSAIGVVAGPDGVRRIPMSQLIVGAMRTVLRRDEILAGFEIPAAAGGHGYHKLKRAAGSWPIAAAAAILHLDRDGLLDRATLVLGGVAAVPVSVALDDLMLGRPPTDELIVCAAQRAVAAVTDPWSDELASGSYRHAVSGPVARRALTSAQHAVLTGSQQL